MKKSVKGIFTFFSILFIGFSILTFIAAQDEKKSVEKAEVETEKTDNYRLLSTYKMPSGITYAISEKHGFLISFDNGIHWEERNTGLPQKIIYPFKNMPVRTITGVGFDPTNEAIIGLTTKASLYVSFDYALKWKKIPISEPLKRSTYLTSVSIRPDNPLNIVIGTSFNGFFETTDGGQTWKSYFLELKDIYSGSGFYEGISAITYSPENGDIIFALEFKNKIYRLNREKRHVEEINIDFSSNTREISNLRFIPRPKNSNSEGGKNWLLEIHTRNIDNSTRVILSEIKTNRIISQSEMPPVIHIDPFKSERHRKASDKFGIYISSHRARGEYLKRHVEFIKKHGLNSMVVDFKDDYGYITYDSHIKLAKRIGSVKRRIDLDKLLKIAHENNIYVIGRVVVFKDQQLYNYKNYKYALWDRVKNAPWRNLKEYEDPETGEKKLFQREYWVDPYSEFVWQYNASIAEELQKRGVDEIQFDYIRFPSDGDLSTIKYKYKRKGMTKIDAIESFLRVARERVHIPISTDVYGFNAWYRMGNWIGQNIEMISNYADAISPMFYPSHFPVDFLKDKDYLERAYNIYKIGTERAKNIVSGRCLIRPFIQAFLIGKELEMTTEGYTNYLLKQIQGSLEARSSGFTLWNASNRYYMVRESLQPIINIYGNGKSKTAELQHNNGDTE